MPSDGSYTFGFDWLVTGATTGCRPVTVVVVADAFLAFGDDEPQPARTSATAHAATTRRRLARAATGGSVRQPRPRRRALRRRRRRSGVVDTDAQALVSFALALGLHDLEAADLTRARDVGTAVGLLVEPDDVDDTDLLHALGNQVHLCADEVFVFE